MPPSHSPHVGRILSADIAVPDHPRELQFYARILTTGNSPLWREDLMNNEGTPIIGLGERVPAYAHLPLQWMPHIQVADVAASVEQALARGGRALMHHKDDGGQSQWAVLVDPNGAAFGIIPAMALEADLAGDAGSSSAAVGRIAWLDLTVPNADEARDFYQAVVGWTVRDVEKEDEDGRYVDHVLCTPDGVPVAGIRHARGENRGLPPVWMLCLPVGDLAESLARVHEHGGEVIHTRKGPHGEVVQVAVRDPIGACLALVSGS